jgi:predicted ATPase
MRPIVLSGCSGGGKSTLIDALAARGFATVAKPGRRAVREGLSWVDQPRCFAERLVELAIEDLASVRDSRATVFFDRGLIDAAIALEHAGGPPAVSALDGHAFEPIVFMLPPWPDLYRRDAERQHGFDAALDEFKRLSAAYPELGYHPIPLPPATVKARLNLILSALQAAQNGSHFDFSLNRI